MRIVDKNYNPLPQNYVFTVGEKLIISDDAWCSYSIDKVAGSSETGFIAKELKMRIVWEYDPYIQNDTWILIK